MQSMAAGIQEALSRREVPTGHYCTIHPDIELVKYKRPVSNDQDLLGETELAPGGYQLTEASFCSQCAFEGIYQERLAARAEKVANTNYLKNSKRGKYKILKSQSLVGKRSLWKASFESFKVTKQAEQEVLNQARRIAREFVENQQAFNVIFTGKAGRGKSHLAMAILQEINERLKNEKKSCLFINTSELVREIKISWNYDDKRHEEERITDLMRTVDYLVIDDLGTEASFQDKQAGDWIQGIIYNVFNVREGNTIITTNLQGSELKKAYNDKIISRILENSKGNIIKFEEITDKRLN
jgi:DNA replication protein